MKSPYLNKSTVEWATITDDLIEKHPLKSNVIVDIVLKSWKWIFKSKIGNFYIGIDIFPTPQIMSFLLHELVALALEEEHPRIWKKGEAKNEKDLVFTNDNAFSIEIKASSDKKHVFGNRSYAQEESSTAQKSKLGYYITINFEKFIENKQPEITIIRFGFLEHTDWMGQAAATGQQARLSADAYKHKLRILYEKKD
jgi:hypothetical protein